MSETVTMTLTEFLLARIAEDEAMARNDLWGDGAAPGTAGLYWWHDELGGDHIAVEPRRVLAECEAKRRIVGSWVAQWSIPEDDFPSRPLGGQGGEVYYDVLCHLAAVYADHPDYRDEWRP